jgi:hypothetical protein
MTSQNNKKVRDRRRPREPEESVDEKKKPRRKTSRYYSFNMVTVYCSSRMDNMNNIINGQQRGAMPGGGVIAIMSCITWGVQFLFFA